MSNYHQQMMNLRPPDGAIGRLTLGYKNGHRDARHAAAEIAARADTEIAAKDARIAELEAVVEKLPLTADGVRYTGGNLFAIHKRTVMEVEPMHSTDGWEAVCVTHKNAKRANYPSFAISSCYSTPEAAAAALAGSDDIGDAKGGG